MHSKRFLWIGGLLAVLCFAWVLRCQTPEYRLVSITLESAVYMDWLRDKANAPVGPIFEPGLEYYRLYFDGRSVEFAFLPAKSRARLFDPQTPRNKEGIGPLYPFGEAFEAQSPQEAALLIAAHRVSRIDAESLSYHGLFLPKRANQLQIPGLPKFPPHRHEDYTN